MIQIIKIIDMHLCKQLLSCSLLAVVLVMSGCKKDAGTVSGRANRLGFILGNNFNLTLFNVGLTYTHYSDTLLRTGPYTVLAPSDKAFQAAGYANAVAVQALGAKLWPLMSYHILGGYYPLDQLPFQFNQELRTLGGASMYVTHWIKNKDTVITINGARVVSVNQPGSNGLIQVLDQVLSPSLYGTVQGAIGADTRLTFFNAALLRSGMAVTLQGKGPYTVFAPTNEAFKALGFPSADSINQTDPSVLAGMLNFHILTGRRFINDYILTTDGSKVSKQAMLNGNNVTIKLLAGSTPGSYSGISLQGSGNIVPASLVATNVLAGNGVLHCIDQVLKEQY